MARTLALLLLAFSALALIAIACSGEGDFLLDDEPNATGTPPFFERSPQPTPIPTPTAAAAIGECGETYTVEAGDSPFSIAEKCGVDVNDLQELNGIDDPRNLKVGQELKMPPVQPTATATATATPTPTATPTATPTGDAE
jgi:hypothetical protein